MRTETSHRNDMSPKIRMTLLCITCTALAAVSCRRDRDIIPENVMSRIYYDMYMTDEAVKANIRFRRMIDTLRIYEPVFNRYGYTSEDYTRSVDYYLERPDRFQEVFENTKLMLELRKAELEKIIEAEENRPKRWSVLDSLDIFTADGVHSPRMYKNLRILFFQRDSMLVSSPAPDSALMLRPSSPFMIFSDSALNSDSNFEFHTSAGFMLELDSAEIRQSYTGTFLPSVKNEPLDVDPESVRPVLRNAMDRPLTLILDTAEIKKDTK